jgi:hypothetical protein
MAKEGSGPLFLFSETGRSSLLNICAYTDRTVLFSNAALAFEQA